MLERSRKDCDNRVPGATGKRIDGWSVSVSVLNIISLGSPRSHSFKRSLRRPSRLLALIAGSLSTFGTLYCHGCCEFLMEPYLLAWIAAAVGLHNITVSFKISSGSSISTIVGSNHWLTVFLASIHCLQNHSWFTSNGCCLCPLSFSFWPPPLFGCEFIMVFIIISPCLTDSIEPGSETSRSSSPQQ